MPVEERLFTKAFVALTLSDLAYFLAAGLLLGVTPFFVVGPLGSTTAGLGVVLGAFSVTALLLRPVAGQLTDRVGRRPLLLIGAALCLTAVLAHLVVQDLWALVAVRIVLGVAEALYFVAGFAALADLAPPGRAGEALSWNSLTLYTGIAAGPGLGQLLLRWHGYPAAWLGGAVLAALAAVLVLRVPETRSPGPPSQSGSLWLLGRVVRPSLALCAGVGAAAGFLALGGLQAERSGLAAWSLVPLVYGAVVIGCRVIFAKLPDRLPPLRLAAASLLACTVGLLILGLVPRAGGLFAGAVVLGTGVAFLTPAVFSAVFSSVPAHQRGSAAGTITMFIDVGLGGGPLLLGILAAHYGIPPAFLVAAAVAVVGALAVVRQPGRPEPSMSEL